MTDAKQPERNTRPFTAGDAAGTADALRDVGAALRRLIDRAEQFDYPEPDYWDDTRGLLRHANATVDELVGVYRAYAVWTRAGTGR